MLTRSIFVREADCTFFEVRPYATMVKTNKRKRKTSPPPSMVPPSRSATNAPTNSHSVEVMGKVLVEAFKLATTDEKLHNEWFSAADWCSILPSYCSLLKGNETQVTTRKFTKNINKIAEDMYNNESKSGVYSNKYGNDKQMYYLFTKEDRSSLYDRRIKDKD